MLHLAASWMLAAVLAAAAVAKLAAPADSRAALATFGLRGERGRSLVWIVVVSLELALAAGVAAGVDAAAYAAAGLMACFAGALAGVLALAVAVLALAREVGMLRLAAGAQGALEVPDEGPPVGEPSALAVRFASTAQTRLDLAVFSSDGCALCQAVAPSVELLAREPWLAVEVFDEVRHADAWSLARVPGSPYAVALDPLTGTVLAKGTFNGLAQLESVLATAERRALEAAHA